MQAFKESQEVKEQEIYACMLHGLFDEYRFLHRYPQQYLTKIAKLFGAIIKNNLLDRVLQDIALKFVIEAFRRDGRRQKFGIIVIKSFFDRLPQFPKFLEDIYQIRQSIQASEPAMMADIERLYHETVAQQNQATGGVPRPGGSGEGGANDNIDDPQSSGGAGPELVEADMSRTGSDGNQSSLLSLNSGRAGQAIDGSHKQAAPGDAKPSGGKDQGKKNS